MLSKSFMQAATATSMLLWIALVARAQPPATTTIPAFDAEAIAARGQQSRQRHQDCGQARWIARHQGREGPSYQVEMIETNDMARWSFSVDIDGTKTHLFQIIDREGDWFLKEFGEPIGQYRPYEAPLTVSSGYELLLASYPLFAENVDALASANAVSTEGDVVTLLFALDDADQSMVRNILKLADDARRVTHGTGQDASIEEKRQVFENLLETGYAIKVDVRTGLIVERWIHDRRIAIDGYVALDEADNSVYSIDAFNAPRRTSDPTERNPDDLIMIQHCGLWRRKTDLKALDGRLLDVKTGELRRIPYEGAYSNGLCFSNDRRRAYILGTNVDDESVFSLAEIDLTTGSNRDLTPDLPLGTIFNSAAVSHDGKTLAVIAANTINVSLVKELFRSKLVLIDLETTESRTVGVPADMTFVNWLPADQGWLLRVRERQLDEGSEEQWICRMSVDGTITKIRRGDRPQLLPDAKTILFWKPDAKLWYLCDLDGGNERLLADGMPDYNFPAVAPDGKRMIMMRFGGPRGPVPELVTFGNKRGQPITRLPGLWGRPVWR